MILKKLATSPLTSQTMLKMGVNESVWGHNIVGGSRGGGRGKGGTLCNNYLEGFSHRFPSSLDFHCSVK